MPRNENGSNTDMPMPMPDINVLEKKTSIHNPTGRFARPVTGTINDATANITNARTQSTIFNAHQIARSGEHSTMDTAQRISYAYDVPVSMSKVQQHERICHDLNRLYERKNHDYGDAFAEDYSTYGLIMPVIRLDDKLRRLKHFVQNNNIRVPEETIEDTLMDLANYSIMTLIELHNRR